MANVAVTVQNVSEAGIAPTYAGSLSTSNVYQFANDGNVFLHIKKSDVAACTATAVTPGTVGRSSLAIADKTTVIPASTGDVMWGPFPPAIYNDANGLCSVSFSEIAGLTFGAFSVR